MTPRPTSPSKVSQKSDIRGALSGNCYPPRLPRPCHVRGSTSARNIAAELACVSGAEQARRKVRDVLKGDVLPSANTCALAGQQGTRAIVPSIANSDSLSVSHDNVELEKYAGNSSDTT